MSKALTKTQVYTNVVDQVQELLKQKKVMVTVNKRIASESTEIYDGDMVQIVAHDGLGRSGLTPAMY